MRGNSDENKVDNFFFPPLMDSSLNDVNCFSNFLIAQQRNQDNNNNVIDSFNTSFNFHILSNSMDIFPRFHFQMHSHGTKHSLFNTTFLSQVHFLYKILQLLRICSRIMGRIGDTMIYSS